MNTDGLLGLIMHISSGEFQMHNNDFIIGAMAYQITSLTIYLPNGLFAFVGGIHQWPVNSPHKRQVTRKMFPFDKVIKKISQVLPEPMFINSFHRLDGHFMADVNSSLLVHEGPSDRLACTVNKTYVVSNSTEPSQKNASGAFDITSIAHILLVRVQRAHLNDKTELQATYHIINKPSEIQKLSSPRCIGKESNESITKVTPHKTGPCYVTIVYPTKYGQGLCVACYGYFCMNFAGSYCPFTCALKDRFTIATAIITTHIWTKVTQNVILVNITWMYCICYG